MSTKTTNRALRRYQTFFVVLGVLCVAAIALNLVVRRVPAHDATIESDFSSIYSAIDSYASQHSQLPAKLSDVTGLNGSIEKRLAEYEYVPSFDYSYQLCATFLGEGNNTVRPYISTPAKGFPDTSRHGKGRECFTYTASQGISPLDNRPSPVQ